MSKKHVPSQALTRTEAEAERLRRMEPKCYQCVNACRVFEVYVCDIDLCWPKCIDKEPGYAVKKAS